MSIFFLVKVNKWFKTRKNIPHPSHSIFKPIIYYFIPVIIVFIAWGTLSYKKTGHFFYNQNYENTSYAVFKPESMSKDEWNYKYKDNFKSMSDVIFEDAGKFIKVIFIKNLPTYIKKDLTRLLPKYFGIFVILGMFFFIVKYKKTSITQKYFFLASILFYLQILLIFYTERFSIPLLPFYCFMILWFFSVDLFDRFNFRISSFRLFGIILSMLIAYNLYTSYNHVKEEINLGPMEILTIKKQVENNKSYDLSGKIISSRKPHIAYYLGMESRVTPFVESYEEYINYVRANNIEYVYISEREADYLTDENLKQVLLDYANPPADLEIVTFTLNPIAVLYKVKN